MSFNFDKWWGETIGNDVSDGVLISPKEKARLAVNACLKYSKNKSMTCQKCGKSIEKSWLFCPQCGSDVHKMFDEIK